MKDIETSLIDRKVIKDIIQCAVNQPTAEIANFTKLPKLTSWNTKTFQQSRLSELFPTKLK